MSHINAFYTPLTEDKNYNKKKHKHGGGGGEDEGDLSSCSAERKWILRIIALYLKSQTV